MCGHVCLGLPDAHSPSPLLWGSSEGREINLRLLKGGRTAHSFILWSKLVWISKTSASFHKHFPTSSNIFNSELKISEIQVTVVKSCWKHRDLSAEVCSNTPLVPGTTGGVSRKIAASEEKDKSLKFGSVGGVVFKMFIASLNPSCLYQWGIRHQQRPTSEYSLPVVYEWDYLKWIVTQLTMRVCRWKEGIPKWLSSTDPHQDLDILHVYIYIYVMYQYFKIGQSSAFAKLSQRCLFIWCFPSFRPAFASWVFGFRRYYPV